VTPNVEGQSAFEGRKDGRIQLGSRIELTTNNRQTYMRPRKNKEPQPYH